MRLLGAESFSPGGWHPALPFWPLRSLEVEDAEVTSEEESELSWKAEDIREF